MLQTMMLLLFLSVLVIEEEEKDDNVQDVGFSCTTTVKNIAVHLNDGSAGSAQGEFGSGWHTVKASAHTAVTVPSDSQGLLKYDPASFTITAISGVATSVSSTAEVCFVFDGLEDHKNCVEFALVQSSDVVKDIRFDLTLYKLAKHCAAVSIDFGFSCETEVCSSLLQCRDPPMP